MLAIASAAVDWFAGAEILAAISYLNWLCQPGEAFVVVTFLAAVGLFSAFAKNVSSDVFVLAANVCFAVLLLAPLDASTRISTHTILAVAGFLPSSLALTLLIHRLRKLNAIVMEMKSANAAPGSRNSPMTGGHERGPTDSVDIRAFLIEEMHLSTLEELSASITHEIAQPLSAIVLNGNAGLRWLHQDDPPKSEVQGCIERMTSDGWRASAIMVRIHERCQRLPPPLTPTAMNDVVRELAPFIRRQMAGCGGTVELRLSPSLPDTLANATRLQQVFINLTHNALQAMAAIEDRPAQIVISTWATEAGAVAFSVADNGPGIACEEICSIFEPFVTTRERAIGLGLSSCRSIVEAHSGEISASNNPDYGAIFIVTLPPFK
jgi:signal transduction histidine kinase